MNRPPDKKMPAKLFLSFVYGWYRPSLGRYLYVGCSVNKLTRLVFHDIMGKVDPFQEEDEIHFWKVPLSSRFSLEESLVRFHKPLYQNSRRGLLGSKPLSHVNLSVWRPKEVA